MEIHTEDMRKLGADMGRQVALRLKKSLYELEQAGRSWSHLLHGKLEHAGFARCTTDISLYFNRLGSEMIVVGVYIDNLMVTESPVEAFLLQ